MKQENQWNDGEKKMEKTKDPEVPASTSELDSNEPVDTSQINYKNLSTISLFLKYYKDKEFTMYFGEATELFEKGFPQLAYVAISKAIRAVMPIITTIDNNEMFFYNDETGLWEPTGKLMIEKLSSEMFPNISRNALKEIIKKIQLKTDRDRAIFNSKKIIGLHNCVIELQTGGIMAHSKDHYLTRKLDIVYDPLAECPAIDKFLSEVATRDDVKKLLEMTGYCLWPEYNHQISTLLLGGGSNGKSTFLSLLKSFIGSRNVAALTMHQLSRQFATAQLYGKMANICADLPSKAITDTGIYKMATGGDLLTCDQKNRSFVQFVNIAKFIFSCNEIPASENDESDAWYRRFLIIDFPNQFTGDNADPNLLNKLTTEKELSGFLNRCLDGLERLQNRGYFETGTIAEQKEKYKKGSDPSKAFVHFECRLGPSEWMFKEALYNEYVKYCNENDKIPKASNAFSKLLIRWAGGIETSRRKKDGLQKAIWKGISHKSKPEEKEHTLKGL